MLLTIILSIYFIPIIIFWILVYYNMKKGQSVEEFIEKEYCEDYIKFIFFPIFNWLVVMAELINRIWNKIKKFRK